MNLNFLIKVNKERKSSFEELSGNTLNRFGEETPVVHRSAIRESGIHPNIFFNSQPPVHDIILRHQANLYGR
jgi:hypothetical protein